METGVGPSGPCGSLPTQDNPRFCDVQKPSEHLMEVTLLEQEVGADDLQRSLSTLTIL